MISNFKKHKENMKLADKRQQPFEMTARDIVERFNRGKKKFMSKNQTSTPIPKRKK